MDAKKSPPAGSVPVSGPDHVTYHLVPSDVWEQQKLGATYLPDDFEKDGFIHCTDTLEELVAVGNRYYREDPREFLVLAIDCDLVSAPIVYEDDRQIFPHIYGPLDGNAVLSMQGVVRDRSGAFLTMG
jgi:uncharacterized protein (DUF952 family)